VAIEKGHWRLIYNPDGVFPLLMLFLNHIRTRFSHPSSCLILSISFFAFCFVWRKIRQQGSILAVEDGTWDLGSRVCFCIQRSHIPNPTMLNALRRNSIKLKAWYRHACESKEENLLLWLWSKEKNKSLRAETESVLILYMACLSCLFWKN